ncbi:hypothetical protein GCM10010331_15250 [Streptomyces xanthochromogenes]|nr:hypothetical protein GCM10010331_15250 [Streptomyces xanthochromogenes]
MEVGACFVADPEAFERVEPGEGPLDDPPGPAESRTVGGASAGNPWCNAARSKETAVGTGKRPVGSRPRHTLIPELPEGGEHDFAGVRPGSGRGQNRYYCARGRGWPRANTGKCGCRDLWPA